MAVESAKVMFRRAHMADAERLVEHRLRFLFEIFPRSAEDEARDGPRLRQSMARFVQETLPTGDFIAWVAECDGQVVATSGMVFWRSPPVSAAAGSGRRAYIMNMYTIPEFRGQGIGTGLFDHLLDEARSLDVRHISLHATDDGMTIYKRAGFRAPDNPELELVLPRSE